MRLGTCKHYNGTHHNKTCAAGVCYRDVTPEPDRREGSLLRLPCNRVLHWTNPSAGQKEEFAKRGTCEKYEEPTQADIDEQQRDFAQHFLNINKARKAIVAHAGGTGASKRGSLPCPVCTVGTLNYSIAGCNGHVHAGCTTTDCVRWME